jgi:hypothetical protein
MVRVSLSCPLERLFAGLIVPMPGGAAHQQMATILFPPLVSMAGTHFTLYFPIRRVETSRENFRPAYNFSRIESSKRLSRPWLAADEPNCTPVAGIAACARPFQRMINEVTMVETGSGRSLKPSQTGPFVARDTCQDRKATYEQYCP